MIAPNYPPEKQKSAMPKRPNVIWVLADQLRAQALSCNGETNICTPNIDQLAMRGVNFTAAVSGYPLCCPYRGSMLTGLYPNHCTPRLQRHRRAHHLRAVPHPRRPQAAVSCGRAAVLVRAHRPAGLCAGLVL